MSGSIGTEMRFQQVLGIAHQLYDRRPDWVTFFRELLGVNGLVRRTFPVYADLVEFKQSAEFAEIQKLLARLRENRVAGAEPIRVITVRLPQSMHQLLCSEAHEHRTSVNKLCLSKLLQVVDQDMIPTSR